MSRREACQAGAETTHHAHDERANTIALKTTTGVICRLEYNLAESDLIFAFP